MTLGSGREDEVRGLTVGDSSGTSKYETVSSVLRHEPHRWLVTGAAGFIGSHLVQHLLALGQDVVGLDNFSTGSAANLEEVRTLVPAESWPRFRMIEGDIRDLATCRRACEGVDYVLHEAALGSVPRSIEDPIATHASNLTGFLYILVAARDAGVRRFVYAASSSTYGDHAELPKVEERIGRPLSPYAVTKLANELYARVFQDTYGIETVGLRYFNVFGPRQDPDGAYAAVIPRWIASLFAGTACRINGDGESSRDFTFVGNVVQANILAALARRDGVAGEVYNVAAGDRTTLNELFEMLRAAVAAQRPEVVDAQPEYGDNRVGDVRHSQADIAKIRRLLGYEPDRDILKAIQATVDWHSRDWVGLIGTGS